MTASGQRCWQLTQFLLTQALHHRIAWVLGAAALAVVAGAGALRGFNFGTEESRFFTQLARLSLLLSGTVVAALVGPALFGEGLATRTIPTLLTHGARRSEVVVGLLFSLWTLLGWLVLLHAGALAGVLIAYGHVPELAPALRAVARGFGPLLVVGAGAVMAATLFQRSALATAATLALAGAGQFAPVIAQAQGHSTGVARLGWTALDWLVPNFALFDSASPATAALYAVGYAGLYGGVAAFFFARREL